MIFDSIQNADLYTDISPNLKIALDYMKGHDLSAMEPGRYPLADGNVLVIIKKGFQTKEPAQCKWESHREFLDIQYLLSGKEGIGYCSAAEMKVRVPYDPESDKILYHDNEKAFVTRLSPGDFVVLFPNDAHMTLIADGEITTNSTAVIKVRI